MKKKTKPMRWFLGYDDEADMFALVVNDRPPTSPHRCKGIIWLTPSELRLMGGSKSTRDERGEIEPIRIIKKASRK